MCYSSHQILCVQFSVPSHMGTFQRNQFYFLPKDLPSLFPGLPETSISGCDDAPDLQEPAFHCSRFPRWRVPTSAVLNLWSYRNLGTVLSEECFVFTGSAVARLASISFCANFFIYLELIIHQPCH